MHNGWDYVHILYFAGGMRIINENNVFHPFFRPEITFHSFVMFTIVKYVRISLLVWALFHSQSRVVVPATLTQHLCQRSFYKIFVKFKNSKKKMYLKLF
jgi:hypothetical protein